MKIMAVVVGLFLGVFMYLQSQSIITVNWDKLQYLSESTLSIIGNSITAEQMSNISGNFGLPLTGSLSAGLMVGKSRFRRTVCLLLAGKKSPDVPVAPESVYKSHWKGWGHWLGTGTIANMKRHLFLFKKAENLHNHLNLRVPLNGKSTASKIDFQKAFLHIQRELMLKNGKAGATG
ncbi:hypothetical protein BH18THE1_BH18THE1_05280 [soil metagenome]